MGRPVIPRIVHHVWVGDPIPDHLTLYMATWSTVHPGWEHRMWNEDDLRWLSNQAEFDNADILAPGHEGQLRSDLARYEILHRHGGVYVDCDMEARQPLDPLLDVECFAGWETDDLWVNNAVLGSVPGHPMMADLIRLAPASIASNRGKRPNRMTGPHLLTPLARRWGITVHPSSTFYPYRWDELDRQGEDFPAARAVHHWDNKRKAHA